MFENETNIHLHIQTSYALWTQFYYINTVIIRNPLKYAKYLADSSNAIKDRLRLHTKERSGVRRTS